MSAANPKPTRERPIFSAVIQPHRSLPPHGFFLLMASIGGLAFLLGILFVRLGAWPVVGFLGLGVVLVWLAFRANYRDAHAEETVDVSASEIRVRRVSPHGAAAEWRFNPYWAQLHVERDEDDMVRCLALTSHGRRLEIADWLSPPEKADFALALSNALAAVRRGPAPA